mmetsp:Transcript_41101/g.97515  ORF Transcript_41101/g.97515 Transcript_41101/m.97515 type:complete len:188 (+) Transcript_41101:84-647(+)
MATSVIFLDVDGVLACYRSQMGCTKEECAQPASNRLIFDAEEGSENVPLEAACLEQLAWLVKESGAGVVLSTTWRLYPSMRNFLVKVLGEYGVQVLDDTPDLRKKDGRSGNGGRGNEVMSWLESHPEVSNFVVLDDDHRASFECLLPPGHFVETLMTVSGDDEKFDPETGLTPAKAQQALDILRRSE